MLMTILIIENNAVLRRVIRNFVSSLDNDIREYSHAREVLWSDPPPPEWVLFNLEFKDPKSVDSIARIKENWAGAKVIALATDDEMELREAAHKAGAYAYVPKDDLSQLRTLLRP
jgi:DNA-binding NarL/FixJ family response regulator